VAGVTIAAIPWQHAWLASPLEPTVAQAATIAPQEARDFGTIHSDASGLKGRLTTKWDRNLGYRLVVEPGNLDRQAAFALTVSEPPRPLSIAVQLKSAFGVVLCTQEVVLKYDAKRAVGLSATAGKPESSNTEARKQWKEFDRLEAEELDREQGKDTFQNDIGLDGQIESISAHGEIPCSKEEYDRASSWSFAPEFPTVTEQAELQKGHVDAPPAPPAPATEAEAKAAFPLIFAAGKSSEAHKVSAAILATGSRQLAATLKTTSVTTVKKPAYFNIEGDDAIVAYDATGGVIETKGGRIFLVDKSMASNSTAHWQDAPTPANIHYKCDQSAVCTLSKVGATALHVRTRG
jgi:hypothetical protein